MNPLHSGLPAQHYIPSLTSAQSLEASGAQAQPQHAKTLLLTSMSQNTLDVLDQYNQSHELLAMQAIQVIGDAKLSLQSAQGTDAHYATANGDLTVQVRLNTQSRLYDVICLDSPNANPIYLSVPPSSARTQAQTHSVSSHLAAQYSQGQLTQALIRQNNPQDFFGAPLPSGASVSTQGMVFSHDGSANESTHPAGPIRPKHETTTTRSAPYSQSSRSSGSRPTTVQAINCRHKPGGVVNMETFVGCEVTDDELERGDKKANARVRSRKSRVVRAERLGVKTTGEAQIAEKDARAAQKGFANRNEAEQAQRDALAVQKGFADRKEAQLAEKDARAVQKGFADRKEAERARGDVLAVQRGFADRKEAKQAQRDALAVQRGFTDRKEAERAARKAAKADNV